MKNRLIGIYKITNPNSAIYIGQSCHILRRWAQYKSLRNCKGQPRLFKSLKKYGAESHEFEILSICAREELNEKEKHYIELFQSFNTEKGMNLKEGGLSNLSYSDESILKMKKSHTGVKLSEHHRMRQGEGHRGDKHYLFGKHRSNETKEKLRQARLMQPCPRKGKKHSEQTKLKISIVKKGTILTEDWKNKISMGNKGRIVRTSTRVKISEGMRKVWGRRKLLKESAINPQQYSSAHDTHEKVSAMDKGFGHIKLHQEVA